MRIRKPPSEIITSPRKGQLGNIAGIEAPDPYTVVIHLTQPATNYPRSLVSNPFNVMYCKKVAERLDVQDGMKRQIVGAGSVRLTQAIDDKLLRLSRSTILGAPLTLDKIQFFPIRGEVERGAALQGKRIDACYFIPEQLRCRQHQQQFRHGGDWWVRRRTSVDFIPNVQVKPFDNAFAYRRGAVAGDKDPFVHQDGRPARRCIGSTASVWYPEGQRLRQPRPGGDEEIRRLRPAAGIGGDRAGGEKRAMALLEQAGVPRGCYKMVIPARPVPAVPRCFDQPVRRSRWRRSWPGRQRRHSRRRRLFRAGRARRIPVLAG